MKCGKKSIGLIQWVNGKNIHMCKDHLDQVKGLCSIMSWPLAVAMYPEGEKTCESETGDKGKERG